MGKVGHDAGDGGCRVDNDEIIGGNEELTSWKWLFDNLKF
jgi:hypothetical protein